MLKSRYIMIGGFLGAGKTTAILQLGKKLREAEERVGLIMNDQSIGLVDTALVRSQGFETEEITGGCFCCRFNSLVQAAENLSAADRPDVFIAEPVGSCTDLRATVSYPLQKIYGDQFIIAPLSVVLDPVRTRRILGLEGGKTFSEKVLYIFGKQLEEADLLVINKCDLLDQASLDELQQALEQRYPGKEVLRITAREGTGIDRWLAILLSRSGATADSMSVDYDRYAEGEALLGWLNLSASLSGEEFDGNTFIKDLAAAIRERLEQQQIEIAHLKMTLTPDSGNDLAVGNLVRNEGEFELSHHLVEPLEAGELILNLRAEGDPEILSQVIGEIVEQVTARGGLEYAANHLEAFRPGRPVPTHRLERVTDD